MEEGPVVHCGKLEYDVNDHDADDPEEHDDDHDYDPDDRST